MTARQTIREIMKEMHISNADFADTLQISTAALWDRITDKKGRKDISVSILSDMLDHLNYEVVIMPKGKARKVEGAYVVTPVEEG